LDLAAILCHVEERAIGNDYWAVPAITLPMRRLGSV
jgi:hypothetical protein